MTDAEWKIAFFMSTKLDTAVQSLIGLIKEAYTYEGWHPIENHEVEIG